MEKPFLFINPLTHNSDPLTVYPPVGIMSMAACLKKAGYNVVFIDADVYRYSPDILCLNVEDVNPCAVGFTINVSQVSHLVACLSKIIKNYPDLPVILGGPYVTSVKEKIFDDFPGVSYAIFGEGEYALVEFMEFLCGRRNIFEVNNLMYKEKNGLINSNDYVRIKNLDDLPIPDYSIIPDIMKYSAPEPSIASPSIAIMCTRGCPYNCSFCSSPFTWQRKLTTRSVDSVIKEIKYLKENYHVKEIFFQDDTLNARRRWFYELCDQIIAENLHHDIFFKCPFRANRELVDDDLLRKAKDANFWMIFYGVENGNQAMLDSMNKRISVDEIIRAFKLTRKHGLVSYASFMVGNLGETEETVKDSIRLLETIMPDYGGFAIAAPFPGSELYNKAMKCNLIIQPDFKKFQYGDAILRTDNLSTQDIINLALEANKMFDKMKNNFLYKSIARDNSFLKILKSKDNFKQKQSALSRDLSLQFCVRHADYSFNVDEIKVYIVEIENNSFETLSSLLPFPVYLSYHWKRTDGHYVIFDGLRSPINPHMSPGESRLFELKIQSPKIRGKYLLELTLVQEQQFWFEQHVKGLPLTINVEVN